LENIAAAAALAKSFGVESAHIRSAIRGFSGVEHRLELVRELDGVATLTTPPRPHRGRNCGII
jgi:UDP-N-acetylmuramoylalanine--D-glutamate ligase